MLQLSKNKVETDSATVVLCLISEGVKVLYVPTYKKEFVEIFQWPVSCVILDSLDLEDGEGKLL